MSMCLKQEMLKLKNDASAIVLSSTETQKTPQEVRYTFVLDDPDNSQPENYYVAVPAEFGSWISTTLDPSLPIGLLRAMARAKSLSVDGPVDPIFASRIQNEWQRLMARSFSALNPVSINFGSYEPSEKNTPLAHVLAFSGGVDSMYSLLHLRERARKSAPPISHLLFITYERFSHVAASRLEHIQQFADELGLPLIPVRTNFDKAFIEPVSPNYWNYIKIHELLFVAVASALGNNSVNFYFSSTYPVETTNIVDHRISGNTLGLIFSLATHGSANFNVEGAGITRFQKVEAISGSPFARRNLDVCDASFSGSKRNCSRCVKCCQTLVMLDAVGAISAFDQVFDVGLFRKHRTRNYLRIVSSGSPILREIVGSLRKQCDRAPLVVRLLLLARLDYLISWPNKVFRSVKGRVLEHPFARQVVRRLHRRRGE
jgi:hypothetical protein